jgi:hypothetical protein
MTAEPAASVVGRARQACRASARGILLGALLLVPLAASAQSGASPAAPAQSDDLLAPFLGTWSGYFTTQQDPFWHAEDLICFPGCSRDMHDHLVALLEDPANDERPFGELVGESRALAEQRLDSILTPLGRQVRDANAPDNDPKLHCQPYGFVREATNALPLVIRRDGSDLLVHYEEWSLLRTIYMDGRPHPQHRTPTLLGHSVGRIENGVLIVETAQVNPDWISDSTHAGHSGELTAIERYEVLDNPRRLELELTIEDPVMLTEPYVITKTWLYTPGVELVQDQCGALPGKF